MGQEAGQHDPARLANSGKYADNYASKRARQGRPGGRKYLTRVSDNAGARNRNSQTRHDDSQRRRAEHCSHYQNLPRRQRYTL